LKSLPASLLGGKIVIFYPSFESNQPYRNLQFYDEIIFGILTRNQLHPLDSWDALFILVSITFAGWTCFKLPPLYATLTLISSVIVVLFGGFYLFMLSKVFIETLYLVVAMGLCLAIMPVAKFAQKKRQLEEHMSLEFEKKKMLESQKDQLEKQVAERTKELRNEKEETERLLYNILPVEIAKELKENGTILPRRYEEITILFTDFRGFTNTVAAMPANRLVAELNDIFKDIDDIIDKYGIEKIKTIGDSYMVAAGLPKESQNHAVQTVRAALEMVRFIGHRNETSAIKWQMRVGIHSGAAVAGVVGKRKFTYDVWGDTVNIASRMETSGEPGKINISAFTYYLIKDQFDCEYRGKVDAKGKGEIDMYFVLGEKHAG
jgi:class 3 adenylate cyclase